MERGQGGWEGHGSDVNRVPACVQGTTCPGEMVAVEKISQEFHRLRARVD